MQFHELQKKVIASMKYDNPKIMICSGAKRSGKTYVLTFVFLMHISKFKDKGYSFIIGGTTQSSIRRNILNDLLLLHLIFQRLSIYLELLLKHVLQLFLP